MGPRPRKGPFCEGTISPFNPDAFLEAWGERSLPKGNDFQGAIVRAFRLRPTDIFSYHAETATVTLPQVQMVINYGRQGGLHAWYLDDQGKEIEAPPAADITAYTTIFAPTTTVTKGLTGYRSNAKKDSLRATIASHLESQLVSPVAPLTVPTKVKTPPKNPYLDIWAWSCHELEWAGPTPNAVKIQHAHHTLPVLYHHFGCVVPSSAALALIHQVAVPDPKSKTSKPVIEIGSGTGYWTYLLRKTYPELNITAVDSGLSVYRTLWIPDTVKSDGPAYLEKNDNGKGSVLLLVYPSTGEDFTGKVLREFHGDAVIVAGTQNHNGFTGFKDETVSEWAARERKDWKEVCRIPLPSFAGKDEALFIFIKKEGQN